MHKRLILAALAAISIGSAQAVVVVNGELGEDADNVSPFETLQAAIEYANANNEPVIEIQTPGPLGSASVRDLIVQQDITIQGAPGLTPTVGGLDLFVTTGTATYTLNNLLVNTTGLFTPLIAGSSIVANNCVFTNNPAGAGAYGPAVSAAVNTKYSTGTLTMTGCTLIGHWGLEAGRAIRDYTLIDCEVIGQVTDLTPHFSPAIVNAMNWYSGYTVRIDENLGYEVITEPRTLNLDRCIVNGGTPIGWPAFTLSGGYVTSETATLGPINATNTVFKTQNINGRGEAQRIGHPEIPAGQTFSTTFTHCTFRSADAWGFVYMYGTNYPATHTFVNTLFDSMMVGYCFGLDGSVGTNVILTGDANAYHVPAGTEMFPYGTPAFETTKHNYIGNSAEAANITDMNGALLLPNLGIVAQAIATTPLTLIDKDNNPRPLPAVATASDIGADEIDETVPSSVTDWSVF